MVEEVKEDVKHPHPASSETHFASPAHPMLGPATTSVSTCLTNGSDHPSPPVCHQARKWTFNSAVLGAKVADPAFQSVSTEIHIPSSVSSPKIHSSPQSRNTLRPAGCFTLKSYNSITILFNLSPKKEDEEEETDHWVQCRLQALTRVESILSLMKFWFLAAVASGLLSWGHLISSNIVDVIAQTLFNWTEQDNDITEFNNEMSLAEKWVFNLVILHYWHTISYFNIGKLLWHNMYC